MLLLIPASLWKAPHWPFLFHEHLNLHDLTAALAAMSPLNTLHALNILLDLVQDVSTLVGGSSVHLYSHSL